MNPDFIEVYDNALTSRECKNIIEWINKSSLNRGVTHGRLEGEWVVNLEHKDSWQVPGQLTLFSNKKSLSSPILGSSLGKYIPEYKEKYPCLDNRLESWNLSNGYNLQKYDPKQGYHRDHCECSGSTTLKRMMVWMFYLNTVTDNGGTHFPYYDRITDAIEGRLVIWPAYWTHIHCGIVSKTQTKYIATGWFEFD